MVLGKSASTQVQIDSNESRGEEQSEDDDKSCGDSVGWSGRCHGLRPKGYGKEDVPQQYCGVVGGQSVRFPTIDTEIKVSQRGLE